MTTKKTFIVLAVITVFMLAGCGNKKIEDNNIATEASVTVTIEDKITEAVSVETEKSIGEGSEHELTDEDTIHNSTLTTEDYSVADEDPKVTVPKTEDPKQTVPSTDGDSIHEPPETTKSDEEDEPKETVPMEEDPKATLPVVNGGNGFETPEQEV